MVQPDCLNFVENAEKPEFRTKLNLFSMRLNIILSQMPNFIAEILYFDCKMIHTEFNKQTVDHKM